MGIEPILVRSFRLAQAPGDYHVKLVPTMGSRVLPDDLALRLTLEEGVCDAMQ